MAIENTGSSKAMKREKPPNILTKPLPQILDEMDKNIRAAAEAARRAQEAARVARGAAGDSTKASREATKGAQEARKAGEKAAETATRAATEAAAKAVKGEKDEPKAQITSTSSFVKEKIVFDDKAETKKEWIQRALAVAEDKSKQREEEELIILLLTL